MMKLIELRAENFKRLKAVRIRPDGALVQITGRNAQGKSSVLDALWALLGGKDASPKKPIRDGADSATLSVDLGEIQVRRKFTSAGSTLIVETADGLRYQSPQAVLDALVGKLTFDPLAFSRMSDADQAQTLRQIAGYDPTEIDKERARLFDERTAVNRNAKKFQSQLDGIPQVDAPDTEVSISALAKEHSSALAVKHANDQRRQILQGLVDEGKHARAEVTRLTKELASAKDRLKEIEVTYAAQKTEVAALQDPDVSIITSKMEQAEAVNTAVAKKRERAAKLVEFEQRKEESERLSAAIAELDAKKARALASAKFPVEGLSIEGNVVMFSGVPLSQSSSAEQIRVGLAIGAALNPKLRVVLVRDGSLLDANGLKFVAWWAEVNQMQVLMERVADGTATGIVIEDGEVVGAEIEAQQQENT